jgi:catechol 2,3-dioxygenase-like lactoylglutathione lyase family enzyme
MKFWHVGLTVDNLEESIPQYEQLGLEVKDKFEKDTPHALAALMIGPNGVGVELWQWLDPSHPQVEYIKNHLAFLSDDPRKDVQALVEVGCKVVIPENIGKIVTYTFLQDANGTYIEIAEAKEGYGR